MHAYSSHFAAVILDIWLKSLVVLAVPAAVVLCWRRASAVSIRGELAPGRLTNAQPAMTTAG